MNYSDYPSTNAEFYERTDKINIFKPNENKNCFITHKLVKTTEPKVEYGYHKPLNEICPMITGQLNNGPEMNGSSLWNNMTRRKSIVKDY